MHFITFSRQLGTDGGEIARRVADRLGYRLIDTDAIDRKAEEMGFLESVAEMDERSPSFLKRVFSQQPHIDLARLNSVINELGKEGDAVFVGRGGHILLKTFECALHVRVVASTETRIANLVKRGYGERSAEKALEKSDHDRGGFMRFAFDVDWNDSRLYDLVLNMDKLGIDSAVDTVIALSQSDEIKACSLKSLEALGNQALASRVYAAIMEAELSLKSRTIFPTVTEAGKVQLSGFAGDEKSKKRAEVAARRVAGVESVDNQIRVIGQDTND